MSKRRDRAEEKRARKDAEKDLKAARKTARKAIDLKDPRFLGEAAVAATRGPVGLALFGAKRGLKLVRERRAEQAEVLDGLASDARKHAEALKERTSVVAAPPKKRSGLLRRFAPLWIVGLAGGAAVAGATAYFLRDQNTPAPAPAPKPTPAPPTPPAQSAVDEKDTDASGEDLVVDTPDPEGPAGQEAGATAAAAAGIAPQPGAAQNAAAADTAGTSADNAPSPDSATPGAAAGIAPQPADEADLARADDEGITTDDDK